MVTVINYYFFDLNIHFSAEKNILSTKSHQENEITALNVRNMIFFSSLLASS